MANATSSNDASIASALAQLDSIFIASPPSASAIQKQKRARRDAAAVSTPALMSLLPESRKRRRLSLLASTSSLDDTPGAASRSSSKRNYQPSSLTDLLDRLASFTLTLWNDSKPSGCSAVEFARCGWRCTGTKREEVTCETCASTWIVENAKDWRSEEGKRLARQVEEDCRSKHGMSCPWRSRPCSPDLYRLPLSQPPSQLLRDVLARAATYPPDLQVTLSHPLAQEQLDMLSKALDSPRGRRILEERSSNEPSPSQSTIIASLFGWQVMPPSSISSPSSSLSSSTAILQCKYCSRRLLAKSQPSSITDNQDTPSTSPNKLTAVNVKTAHRRFCAYVKPVSESDSREGYQALLEAIVAGTRQESGFGVSEPRNEDSQAEPRDSHMQTKDALKMVKELLRGGTGIKRKILF